MKRFMHVVGLVFLLLVLCCGTALATETSYVRLLGTDGTTTVGVRVTPGEGEAAGQVELVYSVDGVNWQRGSWDFDLASVPSRGGYNGTEFIAYGQWSREPDYCSADGIHWTEIPLERVGEVVTCVPGRAEVNGYHFELLDGELYLVSGNMAALLPDVGAAAKEKSVWISDIQACAVPGGVRVECYRSTMADPTGKPAYVTVYPTSSLDWVRENLSTVFWAPETLDEVDNGTVRVRKRANGCGEWYEYRREEGEWTAIPATWAQEISGTRLLPWNGKTFLILDIWSLQLYASEDGETWRCLKDTFLAPERDAGFWDGSWVNYTRHSLLWTGTEYIACRREVEGRYGMLGYSGGNWHSPYCTKVCFADENFALTGEYDFGRQVVAVGWWNGVYYAEVSESTGLDEGMWAPYSEDEYDPDAPTVIYRSTDKVHWEPTALRQIFDSIRALG